MTTGSFQRAIFQGARSGLRHRLLVENLALLCGRLAGEGRRGRGGRKRGENYHTCASKCTAINTILYITLKYIAKYDSVSYTCKVVLAVGPFNQ